MSGRFYGPCKGIVRRPCGLPATIARVYDHFWAKNDTLKSCVVLTITARCPYGVRTMSLQCVYGLRAYDYFKICHYVELNKIVEATMSVNPYDDRKVSLWRECRTKAHWDKSPLGQKPTGQKPTRTKAHWDKSPLGQKPTYLHLTGICLN